MAKPDLSDYVDVAERLDLFKAKHPDGSVQVKVIELPEPFAANFIAVQASAYRTPDDPRPGIDLAWENVPGKTPYTKDSELMNASTSAIGRAIVAVLAADTKRGVASRQEIDRTRGVRPEGHSDGPSPQSDEPPATPRSPVAAEAPEASPEPSDSAAQLGNRPRGLGEGSPAGSLDNEARTESGAAPTAQSATSPSKYAPEPCPVFVAHATDDARIGDCQRCGHLAESHTPIGRQATLA